MFLAIIIKMIDGSPYTLTPKSTLPRHPDTIPGNTLIVNGRSVDDIDLLLLGVRQDELTHPDAASGLAEDGARFDPRFLAHAQLMRRCVLSFDNLKFRYEPFPMAVATPFFEEAHYKELVERFPSVDLFREIPGAGDKLSLSEKFGRRDYHRTIQNDPYWKDLHRYLKSRQFIAEVLGSLARNHIELGFPKVATSVPEAWRLIFRDLARGRLPYDLTRLSSRFEFSIIRSGGGYLTPHTDSPKKRITLVFSMIGEDEWRPEYGGATDMNRTLNEADSYNWENRRVEFKDVETLHSYEFTPNQCLVFVKTFNSLHSVRPIPETPSTAIRKTLTINIESAH